MTQIPPIRLTRAGKGTTFCRTRKREGRMTVSAPLPWTWAYRISSSSRLLRRRARPPRMAWEIHTWVGSSHRSRERCREHAVSPQPSFALLPPRPARVLRARLYEWGNVQHNRRHCLDFSRMQYSREGLRREASRGNGELETCGSYIGEQKLPVVA